jgi:hypothetical protein
MLLRSFIAALALLSGGAFLWVLTSGSDGPGPAQRPTSPKERKAVRIEKRFDQDPTAEARLLAAMNVWTGAGGERFERLDSTEKPISIPDPIVEDLEAGMQAWSDYLEQSNGKPGRDVAELAGATYFQLLEIGSTDPSQATANAASAVRAQKIVCEHEPILYTLSDLAIYHYFNGEYAAGDKAAKKAAASALEEEAAIKPQGVIDQLNEYKERGEKFVARVRHGFETLDETGEEELKTPIKAYGAPAGINGYEPEAWPQ